MRTPSKILLFLSAALSALVSSSRAQLVTYETISQWTGSIVTLNTGYSYAQTFSNVTAVDSMIYQFAATSHSGTANTNFTAYFVEWDTDTNTAGTVVQNFGTISIPGASFWTQSTTFVVEDEETEIFTYDLAINLNNQLTDPNKTYAMVLTSLNTRNSVGFTRTNTDAFAYGNLVDAGTANLVRDWGFAQLVVEPVLTPVPEASTAAVVFAALLIAALVIVRLRQRRQLALVATQA